MAVGVAVVGLVVGCASEDVNAPDDTVNFTGAGTAELVIDGTTSTYRVACESTELGGQGVLLVSGSAEVAAGEPNSPTGALSSVRPSPVGLELRIDAASMVGTVGANLGGEPPLVVEALDVDFEEDAGVLRATAGFVDVDTGEALGEGSVVLEGCTPGR
jgi:hypothetical protein